MNPTALAACATTQVFLALMLAGCSSPSTSSSSTTTTSTTTMIDHGTTTSSMTSTTTTIDSLHDPMSFWNEMILDGQELLKSLQEDAAATIPAIVYIPKLDPNAKATALALAKQMQQTYKLSQPVPVIKVDPDIDVRSGTQQPFSFEKDDHGTTTSTTMSGDEIAALMNQEYNGFDPSNPSSPHGVYLRVTAEMKVYCNLPCYQGTPDCRISGSIVNYRQMVNRNAPYGIALSFGKPTAWYVNSTLIRTKLGKCSYAWDGGTQGKVNMGCGCHQGASGAQSDCDQPSCPYNNKVPPDYTEDSTAESPNVKSCSCSNMPQSSWPTTWGHGPDCFWKGVAFYPKGGDSPDETHEMLKWRIEHQADAGPDAPMHDPMSFWNEMVLDGQEFLKSMAEDAAATIPAIVYIPKLDPNAKAMALTLATQMQQMYKLTRPVPIIKVDPDLDVRSGKQLPFSFEKGDEEKATTITV